MNQNEVLRAWQKLQMRKNRTFKKNTWFRVSLKTTDGICYGGFKLGSIDKQSLRIKGYKIKKSEVAELDYKKMEN